MGRVRAVHWQKIDDGFVSFRFKQHQLLFTDYSAGADKVADLPEVIGFIYTHVTRRSLLLVVGWRVYIDGKVQHQIFVRWHRQPVGVNYLPAGIVMIRPPLGLSFL